MMNNSTIGDKIRERRKELHMTQKTLAKESYVSRTRLSAIENGTCNDVRVSTLSAIADALKTTV